jgi:hypothetical protein
MISAAVYRQTRTVMGSIAGGRHLESPGELDLPEVARVRRSAP